MESIIRHFAPSLLEKPIVVEESRQEETVDEQPAVTSEVVNEADESLQYNSFSKEEQEVLPLVEKPTEVIKAPKVDLPGLKVLGKIELPEARKKEAEPQEGVEKVEPSPNTDASAKPRLQRSRTDQNKRQDLRKERNNRPYINPIALQREREARAAEERKRMDAIKDKESRTEYYLRRVKSNAPTKAARIYSEPVEEHVLVEKEKPKTWLGKFFRWLTTA